MGEETTGTLLKIYSGGGKKIVLTADSVTEMDGRVTLHNITDISIGKTVKGDDKAGYQIDKRGPKYNDGTTLQLDAEISIM